MSWSGNGSFGRTQDFTDDRDQGGNEALIQADRVDSEFDNFKTGLENCVTRDGQNAATANLPMGTFRHTGVGNASARTMYAAAGQIQDQGLIYCTVGGTGNAITLTPTPAITSYVAGQKFCGIATAANTAAVTVAVSGLASPKNLRKGSGSTALAANDIIVGQYFEFAYDGTQFQITTPVGGQAASLSATYQPLDATLTSLALLGTGAGKYAYTTGVDTWAEDTITAAGRALLDDANAGAQLTTLGVSAALQTVLDDSTIAAAQLTLGVGYEPGCKNLGLALSVSSNILTIALKGADGNDPSATNPVVCNFRNATAATGTPSRVVVTAATSLVVPDTALLGTSNSVAFHLWFVGFNDAGTVRIGVINCRSGSNIYPLAQFPIASSTTVGTGSDSAQVFYTDSGVTSKAYVVLGYATWESGLGTAGTWSAGPTRTQLFSSGMPLPGSTVQRAHSTTTSATSTTSNTFQTTNVSAAITLGSAANIVRGQASGDIYVAGPNISAIGSVHRDSTSLAVQSTVFAGNVASNSALASGNWMFTDSPGDTSAHTYMVKLRNSDNATTVSFPVGTGGVIYGTMQLEEIMV